MQRSSPNHFGWRRSWFLCSVVAGFHLLPASLLAIEVPRKDLTERADRRREFIAFNPQFDALQQQREARLKPLAIRVFEKEVRGEPRACSTQILDEVNWLLHSTADFPRIDRRLQDLETSLAHPAEESRAEDQAEDGSWGRCSTEWFFKLKASYDHLSRPGWGKPTAYPHFLDRVNSPELLTNYILSVWTSDIPHTGRDNRQEFNESMANLMLLILSGRRSLYHWHPHLQTTLELMIYRQLRNPQTRWWGVRYLRDGRTEFVDDLSMTFQAVRYSPSVPNLDGIGEMLLAVKDLPYPVGWLQEGPHTNRTNMQVAFLFTYAWPRMTDAQQQATVPEVRKILSWCLHESLQADGSFKAIPGEGSLEEQTYFGARLLSLLGVFERERCSWLTTSVRNAPAIRDNIVRFVNERRAKDREHTSGYYDYALHALYPIPNL